MSRRRDLRARWTFSLEAEQSDLRRERYYVRPADLAGVYVLEEEKAGYRSTFPPKGFAHLRPPLALSPTVLELGDG